MIPADTHVSPILPSGTAGTANPRRRVMSVAILRNNASGAYSTTSFGYVVRTSSGRLQTLVAWTFKPDGAEDAAFPTSGASAWLLTADAWIYLSMDQGGSPTRANVILGNTPLPFALNEAVQGIDEIRGTVVVPNAPGSGIVPGTLYVTAIWEPMPGEGSIPDAELQSLLGACNVNVTGGVVSDSGV